MRITTRCDQEIHSTASNPFRAPIHAPPSWFDAMLRNRSGSILKRSLWLCKDQHHCDTRKRWPRTFLGCWGASAGIPCAGLPVAIYVTYRRDLEAEQSIRAWLLMPDKRYGKIHTVQSDKNSWQGVDVVHAYAKPWERRSAGLTIGSGRRWCGREVVRWCGVVVISGMRGHLR